MSYFWTLFSFSFNLKPKEKYQIVQWIFVYSSPRLMIVNIFPRFLYITVDGSRYIFYLLNHLKISSWHWFWILYEQTYTMHVIFSLLYFIIMKFVKLIDHICSHWLKHVINPHLTSEGQEPTVLLCAQKEEEICEDASEDCSREH